MDILVAIDKALDGKKTDLTALIAAILGVLQATGTMTTPTWIWPIIGGLGAIFLRAGVRKGNPNVNDSKVAK